MIYTSSMTYIAIISIVIVAIGLLGLNVITYKDRVEKIVKEENKGYLEYQEDYFKNISMLAEDSEFLLNVERNGKWGYINTNGDTKIDFQYDYASLMQQVYIIYLYMKCLCNMILMKRLLISMKIIIFCLFYYILEL